MHFSITNLQKSLKFVCCLADQCIFAKIASEAVDDILKEIELASHVPELAKTKRDTKQDCGGWRYIQHL